MVARDQRRMPFYSDDERQKTHRSHLQKHLDPIRLPDLTHHLPILQKHIQHLARILLITVVLFLLYPLEQPGNEGGFTGDRFGDRRQEGEEVFEYPEDVEYALRVGGF